jgi:hypothetical protein
LVDNERMSIGDVNDQMNKEIEELKTKADPMYSSST